MSARTKHTSNDDDDGFRMRWEILTGNFFVEKLPHFVYDVLSYTRDALVSVTTTSQTARPISCEAARARALHIDSRVGPRGSVACAMAVCTRQTPRLVASTIWIDYLSLVSCMCVCVCVLLLAARCAVDTVWSRTEIKAGFPSSIIVVVQRLERARSGGTQVCQTHANTRTLTRARNKRYMPLE